VKDVQAHLRHSKADVTANEHMQELPASVGRMVESMYKQLMDGHTAAAAALLPDATNKDGGHGGPKHADDSKRSFLGSVSALPTRTGPLGRRTLAAW
jgi:hypothetical protein